MDLNELMIFARVVQAGSFTAAARSLAMPKSTVSRKVAELEQRLGARLLHRTTRRLSLTDAGRAYHQHCARIAAEVEEADQAVTRMQATPRGLLRVTAPVAMHYLAPLISEFLVRYPEVQIELVCTDRLVDLVDEGFDLAIRAGNLADTSLIARRLGSEWRVVVASPAYLAQRGIPAAPEDLARHDGLLFGSAPERAIWRLEDAGRLATVKVPARLTVNDFELLRRAALAGMGIAMLPVQRCQADVQAGRLQRLLGNWCSPRTPIHAVYPTSRHLAPKVSEFVALLQEGFRSETLQLASAC